MKSTDISRLETTAEWSAAITKALHEGAEIALKENEKLPRQKASRSSKRLSGQNLSSLTDFILFSGREFLLRVAEDLSRGNISFSQFYLLDLLSASGEMTMTEIARKMGHSTAAATGLVDRIEKLGYVEQVHAVDDNRKMVVLITRKGIELVVKIRATLQDRVAERMEEYDSTDVDGLLVSAGQLADSVARFLGGIEVQVCK